MLRQTLEGGRRNAWATIAGHLYRAADLDDRHRSRLSTILLASTTAYTGDPHRRAGSY